MVISWRHVWVATGAIGALLLILGVWGWLGNRDFCDGGSHVEYAFLTGAAVLLAVAGIAGLIGRHRPDDGRTRQRAYVVLATALLASLVAVLLIGRGAFDLPWLEKQDVPLVGESIACGL